MSSAGASANPNGIPGRDAYLGPLPLVKGAGYNSTSHFTDPDSAFAIDALLRAKLDPACQAIIPSTFI